MEKGKGVRAEAAFVFNREWEEDVEPSVDPNDRLRGDAVRQKLYVFGSQGW